MLTASLRVILCGLVAGAVWTVLSHVLLGMASPAIVPDLVKARAVAPSMHLVLVGANELAGICAVALYAICRRAGGSFLASVAASGSLWWAIATQQSVKWWVLIAAPTGASVAFAALTLPAMLASVVVGGWLLDHPGSRRGNA